MCVTQLISQFQQDTLTYSDINQVKGH